MVSDAAAAAIGVVAGLGGFALCYVIANKTPLLQFGGGWGIGSQSGWVTATSQGAMARRAAAHPAHARYAGGTAPPAAGFPTGYSQARFQ